MKRLRDFLKPKQQISDRDTKDLEEAYRRVFASLEGRQVLTHILYELYFFNESITTDDEVILSNYAKKLLRRCGVWKAAALQNLDLIGAFMRIPQYDEQTGLAKQAMKGQPLIQTEEDEQ